MSVLDNTIEANTFLTKVLLERLVDKSKIRKMSNEEILAVITTLIDNQMKLQDINEDEGNQSHSVSKAVDHKKRKKERLEKKI